MPQTALTDQTVVGVTNAGAQFAPAVAALPDSFYVIVWLDSQRGAIYGQRYDSGGQRVGGEFQVSSPGPAPLFASVAALEGGGFVVAWQNGSFSSADIHALRFDANGSQVGSEFIVNSNLANEQLDVRIVGLDGGGFLFTWDNIVADQFQDVSGRLYNAAGVALGPDFTINTNTVDAQGISSVAPLAGGGFVATWQSVTPAGSGHALLIGQRFASNGDKIGAEFQVNTATANSPVGNDVARLSDGGFVVSWVDPAPSNGGGRVVARHYDSSGNPLGGEIVIAAKASGGFNSTAVTALADGAYVVSWTDHDAADNNVSARAMGANDAPLGDAFDVSSGAPFSSSLYPDGAVTLANGHVVFTWDGPSTSTSEDVYFRMYEFSNSGPLPPVNGGPGPDVINGTSGDDTLNGLGGDDNLNGMGGNDTLDGGDGADTMSGGPGNDIYYVDNAGDAVSEADNEGFDTVYAQTNYVLTASQHVEVLSSFSIANQGALDLTGNEFDNIIVGTFGANTLAGGDGNDYIIGFAGDDTLLGDDGNDSLFGDDGDDQLTGGIGNDILFGGAGLDHIAGGAGNDTYYVDNPGDVVTEADNEGFDTVYALANYVLTAGQHVELLSSVDIANQGALSLTGNEFDNIIVGTLDANTLSGGDGNDYIIGFAGIDMLFGGDGNDSLFGDVGDDQLSGGIGNDLLFGGAGLDQMAGGTGDDVYYVDGSDVVTEADNEGVDTVYALTDYVLTPGQYIETLSAFSIAWTAGMNLTGNSADNTLVGTMGANILDGKVGNDYLVGFGGADSFAFTTALNAATNADKIEGFEAGVDKILLDHSVFATLGLGGLSAGAFVTGPAAQDADDHIIYDIATAQIFYDADGNGAGAAVLFATMVGTPTLHASDFTVI